VASSGVKLSDLMVSLSLATDLGLGQPAEHMLRASRISMALGARLGLDDAQLAALYDVSLLTYVGCPVYGNEAAMLFGDDIDFRGRTHEVDLVPTCRPASSRHMPAGTAAGFPAIWRGTRLPSRPASLMWPRLVKCSSARPESTRPWR
jgi:hypothetical protein